MAKANPFLLLCRPRKISYNHPMTFNVQRKIIHIDMDCFYAAVEIRDNPELADKPVAVGGSSDHRGVLCTCNYIARKFGVRSAMATGQAYRLCPDLIVLPVNMQKYVSIAKTIREIFLHVTPLVEPLSLDEAYLDVSNVEIQKGSATLIAKYIREEIYSAVRLTASAGVAPNKFLAKIASGWKKPNGLFVIPPAKVNDFVRDLKVEQIHGVGKVTAKKLHELNLKTCSDLQKLTLEDLSLYFGKFGTQLYYQARGIDHREVQPNRLRKSLSVEETFSRDLVTLPECLENIALLHVSLLERLKASCCDRIIKNQYVKIKFYDFQQVTIERASCNTDLEIFINLFTEKFSQFNKKIRLIGIGVHFANEEKLIQGDLISSGPI